jgi:uncharacterized surface protein with fasciclin (FAS1) repeats
MLKSRIVIAACALALGAGLFAQDALANPRGGSYKNIVQIARDAGSFNTLVAALEATGLVGTLSGQGQGPFTVFAPTDAAFAKLPPGTVESLLQNPAQLKAILLYHVVPGEYFAADVLASSSLPTVNGQPLTVSNSGGPKVNDSAITATDIRARNGVIHVIDTVLLPN